MYCRSIEFGFSIFGRVDFIFMGVFFYICGLYYKKYENTRFYTPLITLIGIVCLLITALFFKEPSIQFSPIHLMIPYCIIALIGIITTFALSYLLQKYNPQILYYIGNHTFIVLALHCACFKFVTLMIIYIHGLPLSYLGIVPVIDDFPTFYYIIYAIVGVFLPLAIGWTYEKIRIHILK